jgi:anaerobic selenocysteine-containing dehydrogenase
MNPSELVSRNLAEGALIEISAPHASILGVVKASADVKPGVISMSHGFGDIDADTATVVARGASTNRLVDDEVGYDPITGQCRQSAIAVRVKAVS